MSTTQFAWACCNAGDYPPPIPRKGPRFGLDAHCWLCGGPTHGIGWHRRDGLAATFCDHNKAARMDSETVCQACVALSASLGWEQYASRYPERGLWTHFPDKGNGNPRAFNWLYASHLFRPDFHEAPSRARWRELLTAPPEPPFLMIVALAGKKQIIYRGRVSQSRELFWVQADDTRVLVKPVEFAECLAAFEALYNVGFSKDSIVSGQYHSGQLAKVGLSVWRALEAAIAPWRTRYPGYMLLAHHCGKRAETEEEKAAKQAQQAAAPIVVPEPIPTPIAVPEPPPPPQPTSGQLSLF